jgi:hypothetical protein
MPSTPASLPLQSERPIAIATATIAEPEVQCLVCLTHGPSWAIPDIGRGPRCSNTDMCTKRQMDKLYPNPLPAAGFPLPPVEPAPVLSSPLPPLPKRVPAVVAEAVPVLPPAQEAALERFEAAHEEDAAENRSEDEEPPQAVAEPPAVTAEPAPVAEVLAPASTPEGETQP